MQRPSFQKTLQNYCFFTNNRCPISGETDEEIVSATLSGVTLA